MSQTWLQEKYDFEGKGLICDLLTTAKSRTLDDGLRNLIVLPSDDSKCVDEPEDLSKISEFNKTVDTVMKNIGKELKKIKAEFGQAAENLRKSVKELKGVHKRLKESYLTIEKRVEELEEEKKTP
ncbi:hypothetical protein HOLleu_23479 [Holothuria leucospilota]|uniref:Uncharacterized protein n=1 Tax=Holothuria leucospilota TaxID=206669 RepID=A0A9Q1BVA5_HOLLE|nr:hypothetical protein HOLleu_23479 [Holothuria leucospilota]